MTGLMVSYQTDKASSGSDGILETKVKQLLMFSVI